MPGSPANPDVDPEPSRGIDIGRMATVLEAANVQGNSPHVRRIPKTLEYLRIYALEIAYVESLRQNETHRAFKHRVYETLRTIFMAGNRSRDMRITQLQPTTDWARVWSNLHATWSSDVIKATWYTVIHDILPTNERLHTIRLILTAVEREGKRTPTCTE
jgi:hypothetical protein